MVDCLLWYSCYGNLRLSRKKSISRNFGCLNDDSIVKKKQHNINNNNNNNNNNNSPDESNILLDFYLFTLHREKNLHLNTDSSDKRLVIFSNISNSLHKIGLRNGDILIYLNKTNILTPPVPLTVDRVKSEYVALRRIHKSIQIGICRCSNRSLLNNTTMKHLSSLIYSEFENLSSRNRSNSTHVHTESKKLLNLFFHKKKSDRDSGFVETSLEEDRTESLSEKKSSHLTKQKIIKYQPVQQHLPTQIMTDACFIYRKEVVKPSPTCNALMLRGREIAYEAANSPSLPSSMPYYTHDQIRELYGDLGKKSHCLQQNEYVFLDRLKETCPLPKFRLEKDNPDETIVMAACLSTGLSNPRPLFEKETICGSFRTSIADQRSMTPSPLLLNIQMDFEKLTSTSDMLPSTIDLDEEITAPIEIEEDLSINNLIRIVRDVHQYIYTYDESIKSDDGQEFEELYDRYMTHRDQFDDCQKKEDLLSPISEEPSTLIDRNSEDCLTLSVQRQENHIGHYGFELGQTIDGKIQIFSIINSDYCPKLHVGDELFSINYQTNLKTLEQCHLLFHSLWHKQYSFVEITVKKSKFEKSEPVSLQSSSLSWPLSIIEAGKKKISCGFVFRIIDE